MDNLDIGHGGNWMMRAGSSQEALAEGGFFSRFLPSLRIEEDLVFLNNYGDDTHTLLFSS